MSDRIHVIEDGKLPNDRHPDEWVVFVDSPANAAMWLDAGEPEEAFITIEGVIGYRANMTLVGLGWPVEYDTAAMPRVRDSGHLVRVTLAAGADHASTLEGDLPASAVSAMTALDSLARARAAIENAAAPETAKALADLATRAALMGFAAVALGVEPEAMKQPSIQSLGGAATAEKRRAWWSFGARRAEALALANPSMTLAAIGRKVHRELQASGFDHIPKRPAKVAERLRALGRAGELLWPTGSVAAE